MNPYMNQFQTPYQFQQMQLPLPSPVPPSIQPTQQQATPVVMYSASAKDFSNISLQPGKQALIIAQNEPYMAFKVADNMGMVQTTLYKIEQISEQELSTPGNDYITRNEFQQTIQHIIESIKKPNGNKKEQE